MKHRHPTLKRSLAILLAAVCCLSVAEEAKQGFKEAPQRRVQSKTKNAYCEESKSWYRACYIPCVNKSKSPISHAVNHCNANCENELVWLNYLCRRDPYLPLGPN